LAAFVCKNRVTVFFSLYALAICSCVHDYAGSFHRKFDDCWNCPGLRAAGRIGARGYAVEAAIPLRTLSELLGEPISSGTSLRVGLFRAEFRHGSHGVLFDDAETYAGLGIRHVTTFAVWIDADYLKRFGEPAAIKKYGEAFQKKRAGPRH
jgi:hypothetical protein